MVLRRAKVHAGTALRLEIRGRVQGVGFRWSIIQEARSVGICDWVPNRRDGSVEGMVTGRPEAIDRIVEGARKGPSSAAVTAVDDFHGEVYFHTFDAWPTE